VVLEQETQDQYTHNMVEVAVVLVDRVLVVMLNQTPLKVEMVVLVFKFLLHLEIQQQLMIQVLSGILLAVEEDLLHQEQLRTQELLELVEMVVEEGVLIMMQQFLHLFNITLSMDLRIPEEVVEVPLDLLVIPTLECLYLLLLRVVLASFLSHTQLDK
tara:strand:- start:38 stop:511 length:474 start_codon:yes stop_codon:yes gene_type:complete